MNITRRNVLVGAGAVAAIGVVPIAVAAGTSDPVIAAAAHWHKALDHVWVQAKWWVSHQNPNLAELERDPGLAQEYEERRETLRVANQALSEARNQLLARAPVTAAGALAILGCAARIIAKRRLARENPYAAGTRARVAFCYSDYQDKRRWSWRRSLYWSA
jgi:hypothetical protein